MSYFSTTFCVTKFGAFGNGAFDDTTAIQAAITAACAVNGSVYFPRGVYLVSASLTLPSPFSGNISLIGDGESVSVLSASGGSAGTIPLFSTTSGMNPNLSFYRLGFLASVARPQGYPLLSFTGGGSILFQNCNATFGGKGLYGTGPYFTMSECTFNCQPVGNTIYDSSVHLVGGTINAVGCGFGQGLGNVSGGTYVQGVAPPVRLQGTIGGLQIKASNISGSGSVWQATPTTIASDGHTITATFSSQQPIYLNQIVVLGSCSNAAFNGPWMAASPIPTTSPWKYSLVPFGAFVAPSSASGVSGEAYSPPCALEVDMITGPVNESSLSGGCLIGAGGAVDPYFSCGIVIDGIAGSANSIEGWDWGDLYIDQGMVGILIMGGGYAETSSTTHRHVFSNINCECRSPNFPAWVSGDPYVVGQFVSDSMGYNYECTANVSGTTSPGSDPTHWHRLPSGLGLVWIIKSSSIQLSNINSNNTIMDPAFGMGIYVFNNGGYPNCSGLLATNCNTAPTDWYPYSDSAVQHEPAYGLVIEGGSGTGQLGPIGLKNNIFCGQLAPYLLIGSPLAPSQCYDLSDNIWLTGTTLPFPPSCAVPSVSSASTITLPLQKAINLTGTTSIETIDGGWAGRSVSIISSGALAFISGGNIATPISVAAGAAIIGLFDGSNWHLQATQSNLNVGKGAFSQAAAQTITTISADWLVTLSSPTYDDLGFWSAANPTRFTIPAGVSRVVLTATAGYGAGGGNRSMYFYLNGSRVTMYGCSTIPAAYAAQQNIASPAIPVSVGDYFELAVWEDISSSLALSTVDTAVSIRVIS